VSVLAAELIVRPRPDRSYPALMRQVLEAAIGGTVLEVDWLLVNEPLPDRHRNLRLGAKVPLPQALDLAGGMATGRGPYCRLSAPDRLRIEPGWAARSISTRPGRPPLAWPDSLVRKRFSTGVTRNPTLLEDAFTAFAGPLRPGELRYRAYPGGADTLAEVTDAGFEFMLADRALRERCAVMPDPDGAPRAHWEHPSLPPAGN